jgi:hypothetical protein
MKTYVTLLVLLVTMIMAVPVFAGEEPYVAVINEDTNFPGYYISGIMQRFLHEYTNYYSGCLDILLPGDPRINPSCEIYPAYFICPSACTEKFRTKTAITQPEVCCDPEEMECTETETSLITAGNSGWYEWVIALPKKPEGELNIVIECGVLKPNSWELYGNDAIKYCAAETGEPVAPNCTRVARGSLRAAALPKIVVTAYPGCQNSFTPFHLTAYRNPSNYAITRSAGALKNSKSLQVLDGSVWSRFALKACMDKTIIAKWPVEGEINALGEVETNLEAGDLIKVRMVIPSANTVDVYCHMYSVKIGGIGDPLTLLDQNDCPCILDADCRL